MSADRVKKLHEAARATALARELVERWTVEGVAIKLAVAAKDEARTARCRALQEEILTEARNLTEGAAAIYEELRG